MPPKRKSKDDNFGGEPAPRLSELPTPPSGMPAFVPIQPSKTRTRRAIDWTWKNRKKRPVQLGVGCGSLTLLCSLCLVFSFIGQTLGFIPDATERAQTQTATAAVLAAAQAVTREVVQTREAAEDLTSTVIALSATATNTDAPTDTARPSSTPQLLATQRPTTAALNFLSTNTPQGFAALPTSTLTSTVEPTPIQTQPPATSRPPETYYVISPANARSCAQINDACAPVIQFQVGETVSVIGTTEGDENQGSTAWMIVLYQGQTLYIHRSLLSQTRPAVQQAISTPASNQQLISTPIQSTGFTCNCSLTCTQITTCEEAYFQLNQCGCSVRDDDHDTVPCEAICPGG